MTAIRSMVGFWVVGCLLCAGQQAWGQVAQSGAAGQTGADLSTPAMKYFGRGMRRPARQASPRGAVPATASFQRPGGKPFQNVNKPPALSPYLALDAIESSVGLPNYHARVLPQLQQQEANQAQARQLRRLQQQVRLASAPGTISNNRSVGIPTTGRSAQFLNVGGFFPTVTQQ